LNYFNIFRKFEYELDKLALVELKKIHPLSKNPVINDGNKVLAESGFIIDFSHR